MTYTVDSAPTGGTLRNDGTALGLNDTFTQADINSGLVTFDAGGTSGTGYGFDFSVSDGGATDGQGTFSIKIAPVIVLGADSGATDEDTLTNRLAGAVASVLANDTGESLTVTAYDALSAGGAAVVVNADGTFTYDPVEGPGLQELGTTKPSTNDTFTYTVTDAIGKTDTATVTITVSGIEDTFAAVANHLDDSGLNEKSSKAFTVDLTLNDGIVGTANGTTNDVLVLNYDAAASGSVARWQNTGSLGGATMDWHLGIGVSLNTVTSARNGISMAYTWDGTGDAVAGLSSGGGDSPNDILGNGTIDQASASFEFWVKLDTADLSQTTPLFETGGGTGVGIVIDNGVLKGANGTHHNEVSYDLLTDTLGAFGAGEDPTNEFFQVVLASDIDNNRNILYVNGIQVGTANGTSITDWDGGDGAGLGRYRGDNYGGFQHPAAGTAYDTHFNGSMAVFRIYSEALTTAEVYQNFQAIDSGATDIEGDTITVRGLYDANTNLVVGTGTPITLASGGVVTLTATDGSLSYDPTAIAGITDLRAGQVLTDTVTYQAQDGNGMTNNAAITLDIHGANQASNDTVEATELIVTTFKPSQLVGNDQHGLGAPSPFIDLDASTVTASNVADGVWLNTGSGGVTYDTAISAGTLVQPPESGFGAVGGAWENVQGTMATLTAISTEDATLEVWFKPEFGSTGTQMLLETGGGGTGMSLVYDADNGLVIFKIDSGTDSDTNVQLRVDATGITQTEFNQIIAVYDRDNPGLADSLTLYVNNDATAAFNATPNASVTNSGGGVNNFSGGDGTGIGAINGSAALSETVDPFTGQIAIVRVYDRKLNATEMAAAFDETVQAIQSVSPLGVQATSLGATLTLNADGAVSYDATNLLYDIEKGSVSNDTFTYTINDGVGGTVTGVATVQVTGVGNFFAIDDSVSVGEDDGATAFYPTNNDLGMTATTVVQLETVVADYRDDYQAGSVQGEPASFTNAGGYGWQFFWNAPTDWDGSNSTDATTGPLGVSADYELLKWNATGSTWTADGDNSNGNGAPANYLRLNGTGGHPGRGSTQAEGVTNNLDRAPIAAYTVSETGYYGIRDSLLNKVAAGNTIKAHVYVEDTLIDTIAGAGGSTTDFDIELGHVAQGETIYVAIAPDTHDGADAFNLDFTIVKLPHEDSELIDIFGTVTTDGTNITYDPNGQFESLAVGQSVFESFTYTVYDPAQSETSTADFVVEIIGVNDAPVGVADNAGTITQNATASGDVLANDTDVDQGDVLGLVVSEVMGGAGNVGVATTTANGGSVTAQANGSYVYDPNGAFDGLQVGESAGDSFTYLVADAHGLDAALAVTVPVTITGLDDGVIATSNHYSVAANTTVSGNVITDDTGDGADSSIDTNDVLSILSIDTSSTRGIVTLATNTFIGTRGTISNLKHTPLTITFDSVGGRFSNPIVFANPPSFDETEPVVVRVSNVTSTTFDIVLVEQPEGGAADDGDGPVHTQERVSWVVLEAGQHQLANGTRIEVGTVSTTAIRHTGGSSWETVSFATAFGAAPIVFNQIQTLNGTAAENADRFGTRMQNLSATSFDVAMEDYQGASNPRTTAETIGWLAIEAGAGRWGDDLYEAGITGASVKEDEYTIDFANNYGSAPDFIAAQATYAGGDPTQLRFQNLDADSVGVRAREDTYGDAEIAHALEQVTYLAIGGSGDLYGYPLGTTQGAFTYDPNGAFDPRSGETLTDTFSYTITDDRGNTDTATVTITITPAPMPAAGDFAVYNNAGHAAVTIDAEGGANDTIVNVFSNVVVAPTRSYELTTNGNGIVMSPGKHLVLYNTRLDVVSGGFRAEMVTHLTLESGGVTNSLAGGWAQGFIRDASGSQEAVISGGAIIEAGANEILRLHTARTDINAGKVIQVEPGHTAIQVLKLDDDLDYLRVSQSTNVAAATGATFEDVNYDTVDQASAAAMSFSAGTGAVTLNDAGHYLVLVNTYLRRINDNATRTGYTQQLTINGTPLEGSKTTTYLRGSQDGEQCNEGTLTLGMIIEASAGQVLNVEQSREGAESANIIGGQTALAIVKLPAGSALIRLEDTTGQNINAGSDGGDASPPVPMTFSTQLASPATAFSHTVSNSVITINTNDTYLFLGAFFCDDDTADRQVPNQQWSVNSSTLSYGESSQYSRNSNVQNNGNWSGFLASLSAGNSVEMTSRRLANGSAMPGDSMGLQGAGLFSVIAAPMLQVNERLHITASTTETITSALLLTVDSDTSAAGLTYTLLTAPTGGTLRNGVTALGQDDIFTQENIDNGDITFQADAGLGTTFGFTFSVSDGGSSQAGGHFDISIYAPIAIANDSGSTDEDTVVTQVVAGASVLDNDAGDTLTVTAYDPASANGAVVVVNTDGTFSYDPAPGIALQQLGTGDADINDTFTYTVTDVIGKMDTGTVTIAVSQVEDTFAAVNNYLLDTGLKETASKAYTVDLTPNDGIVRTANGTSTDVLVLNYDAAATAGNGKWENLGSVGGSTMDWLLGSGVTLSTVTSTRGGISAAYTWDGTSAAAGTYNSGGDNSVHRILGNTIDTDSASFEFWVKLDAVDLTQVSTLFETGGGTGVGIVVSNGVLKAANGILHGVASYDLVADSLNTLGAHDPTNEFFQVVFALDFDNDLGSLYVNGTLVDSAANTTTDWDGGDGSGLGHYGENNHGGFQNGAGGTIYDTYFNGSMAAFRIYSEALTPAEVYQNYQAIDAGGTDIEGDTLTVSGIYDGNTNFVAGTGTPATLASGGVVTLNTTAGHFTFDPTGIAGITDMVVGETQTDSFVYRASDGNGQTDDATVTVAIHGANQTTNDTLEATEWLVTTFEASDLVGNDQHSTVTTSPLIDLNANNVTAADMTNGIWRNAGSGGVTYNMTVNAGSLVDGNSNFGGLDDCWDSPAMTMGNLDAVSTDDATFEIWFKPVFGTTGKKLLFETGGDGNGLSIVFDADLGQVTGTADCGDNGNPSVQLRATAGGISYDEFNQVIMVYDRDNPGNTDSLTLYVNNNPVAAFDATADGSHTNSAGGANDWCGTDDGGIGAVYGTAALSETPGNFGGRIAILRVHDRVLTATEMEECYNVAAQSIQSISPASPLETALGAIVTLNADGSITYDATSLSNDVAQGTVSNDTFTYTISDGAGGTDTATVTVNVTGVGNFFAIDDSVAVNENDPATAFYPTNNDLGVTPSTVIELESVVADYQDDYQAGASVGQEASFTNASGYGWQFVWNAPTDWDGSNSLDGTTGPLGVSANYKLLKWSGTKWSGDGDDNESNGEPSPWLRFLPTGGHPGRGSTQDSGITNTIDRAPIAAFTVGTNGHYGIRDSFLTKTSGNGDSISAHVYVDDTLKRTVVVSPASTESFDMELGAVNAGQTIYVAMTADGHAGNDGFTHDFTIIKLPDADYEIIDILGTVTTDGTSITYDPNGQFESLAVGQSAFETFTYTIRDGADVSTATITVEVDGENDAPVTVDNLLAGMTDEDTPLTVSTSVLDNDTDIDRDDALSLAVAEVQGNTGNVGVSTPLPSGATVNMAADGTFVYDPNSAFDGMQVGESVVDSFTYLVEDAHGLDAAAAATVSVTVTGADDGVIATSNDYSVAANTTVTGNLITDNTGSGADSSIDTNDVLSIHSFNTSGTKGLVTMGTSSFMGTRGMINNLTHVTQTITFDPVGGRFSNPVVFANPPSWNETEPSIVLVSNITATTFDIRIKEQPEGGAADDGDGETHASESVSWIVLDAGQYQLADGARMEVGTVSTSAIQHDGTGGSSWQTVSFASSFGTAPVVFNQIQTYNGTANENEELFGTRMNGPASTASFQVALEDIEGDNDARTTAETIGWMAIEPGSGTWGGANYEAGITGAGVNENEYTIGFTMYYGSSPDFIASQATINGADPTQLRYQNLGVSSVGVRAREDTFANTEIGHAAEMVTYLAIGGTGDLHAYPQGGAQGSFTYDPNGQFDPLPGETLTDTFSYTLTDGRGNTDTANVTITITHAPLPAVGDFAVYNNAGHPAVTLTHEGGATDSIANVFSNVVVAAERSYALATNGNGVVMSPGKHLVLYNTRLDHVSGGARAEMLTHLALEAGAVTNELAYGRAQGFIRFSTGADEAVISGGTIVEADANDVLRLSTTRTDVNSGKTVQVEPGHTAIQLLKLDDSLDYLRVRQSANTPAATGTAFEDVTYDTIDEASSGAMTFVAGTGAVTLNDAGRYLVLANTHVRRIIDDATRTSYAQQLTLDGAALEGSKTTTYLRGSQDAEQCNDGVLTLGMIIEATAGQILNVEQSCEYTRYANIIGNRTALAIVKLPAGSAPIRLQDTTGQNINPGTDGGDGSPPVPMTFASQLAVPTVFSHTAASSVITVNTNDTYLFLGAFFCDEDTADRQVPNQQWSVSGSTLGYGESSQYSRNQYVNNNGNWSGFLAALSGSDTVEMTSRRLANGTAMPGHSMGLQGVGIVSLSAGPALLVNERLDITANTTETITSGHLLTRDSDTSAAGLTYTVDSAPNGGTLYTNGVAVGVDGTFTQQDINDGNVTFGAGAGLGEQVAFAFSVSDGSDEVGGHFTIKVYQPIVLVADSASTDEDTSIAELVGAVTSVLANDTGDTLTISAYDSISSNGAAIAMNIDGTFSYDPVIGAGLQALGTAKPTTNDLFTYTVTDIIGKTATATVTVAVTGIEDTFAAVDNYVDDSGLLETGSKAFSVDLTDNDGIVRTANAATNVTLLLNYDAAASSGHRVWENVGKIGGSSMNWLLGQGISLNTVTSSRDGISRAFTWDGSTAAAGIYDSGGLYSIHDILGNTIDTDSASFEFWVKLNADDLTQISTLFETGGGTGIGIIIDNGVLKAANGIGVGEVTYDLVADGLGVFGAGEDPTNEFFQVVFAVDFDNDQSRLYVNGTHVATAVNTTTDWDGGDGSGLGHFAGANHGGFQNGAGGTAYDTYLHGSMAAFRIYGEALVTAEVYQNFQAVDIGGVDIEGDALNVAGIYNTGGGLVAGTGTPVTLASGGVVTLDAVDGSFTYDPTGIAGIADLTAGREQTDTFDIQVADGNGNTNDATITVVIHGVNQASNITVAAEELVVTTFEASELVGNDQHALGAPRPYLELDANMVTTQNVADSEWLNTGTGGATYDVTVTAGALVSPESNFGAIGKTWDGIAGSFSTLEPIATQDATLEVWFKPEFGTTGKQMLMETGGDGNGMSLVYDGTANIVTFKIDGGNNSDPNVQLQVDASGITQNEFNQIIAVYDKDSPTVEDALTLYVNNNPAAAFNATPNASVTNSAGGVNNFSGSNPCGIGATSGTAALGETVNPFTGQIAIVRVYRRKLTTAEMAANFNAAVQGIQSVSPASPTKTALGASVTLNADGSVSYDATGLNDDIPDGVVSNDTFTYTIGDGEGGTTIATVSVNVTGVGNFFAIDDNVAVNESDGATDFDPKANDLGVTGSTVVELESVVADYQDDYQAGTFVGELASFTNVSGHGWQFMWNAPLDWNGTTSSNGTTGPLGVSADYVLMKWSGTRWTGDGDDNESNGPPSPWLRFLPTGGHPGRGSTQDDGITNNIDRAPIAAYTVSSDGYYGISDSLLTRNSAAAGTISARVYVEDALKGTATANPASTVDFDMELGSITAGQTIYVAVTPDGHAGNDGFNLNYTIVRLPDGDSEVIDIIGTVTTDGTNITYDPNGQFESLAVGQSVNETFTYSIRDGGDVSTADFTVTVNGENDAPVTVADSNTTDEDNSVAGDVTANDTDIDQGDVLHLAVAEVEGDTGNVGVAMTTAKGGVFTIQANGNYTYDPNGQFESLAVGESTTDSITYLVEDQHGLDAAAPATVTITITGADDGVIATANDYTIKANETVDGNLMADDTGSGVDRTIDTSDPLFVLSIDTTGTQGSVTPAAPQTVARGVISNLTHVAQTVTFDATGTLFSDPVVFANPPSDNDDEPSIVLISNVTATSFDVWIKEQPEPALGGGAVDGDGDVHSDETVTWMVMQAGMYRMTNGILLEVGKVVTSAIQQDGGGQSWETVNFTAPFSIAPAVFNQIQTFSGSAAEKEELFGTRMSGVATTNSFQVALEDIEGDDDARSTAETIGWFAIEPGSGNWDSHPFEAGFTPNAVVHTWHTINFGQSYGSAPHFLASQATIDGADPTQLRHRNLGGSSVQVRAAEDTYANTETNHADEIVAYFAIGGSGNVTLCPAEGSFTYDPNGVVDPAFGETETDTFSYTITDGRGNTDTATVTITVEDRYDRPTLFILR